jgi:hypothetical protein
MNDSTLPDFLPRHGLSGVIDTHLLLAQVKKLAWQQAALRLWEVFERFPEVHSCIPVRTEYEYGQDEQISVGRGDSICKFRCKGEEKYLPKAKNDAFISAIQKLPSWRIKGDKGSQLTKQLLGSQLHRATYWQRVEQVYDKNFGQGQFKTARVLADQDQLDQNLDKAPLQTGKPFRL